MSITFCIGKLSEEWSEMHWIEKTVALFLFLLVLALIHLGVPLLCYWLYNLIASPVFKLPSLTYWQVIGMYWLCRLFCKSQVKFDKNH